MSILRKLLKDKITLLRNYQSKSTIVNPKINNVDVFTIVSDEDAAFVNYLNINSGAIVQAHTIELKKKLKETDEQLLQLAFLFFAGWFVIKRSKDDTDLYIGFGIILCVIAKE